MVVREGRIETAPALTCSMAGIALIGGQWMISAFSGGNAAIVATAACVCSFTVRKRAYQRRPTAFPVAGITSVAGQRVGARFGCGHAAVTVATYALVRSLIVIEWHNRRQPRRNSMTCFTSIGSLGMATWFARRLAGAGMTSCSTAIGQYGLAMIHVYRQPRWIAMTKLAGIGGRGVIIGFAPWPAGAIMTAGFGTISG
jgi:hypothetical protein